VTQTKDRKNDMTIFALGSNEAVSVGEPLVLPGPAGGFGGVVWSPDSQRVAFVVASPSEADQLRVLRPGSTESITIAVSKPTSQSRTTLIGWTAANDVHFSQSTTGGNDFFLVNASGGSPRRICEGRGQSGGDGCNAMISPDGRWQIVRRNVAGGGKIVLRSLQDGSERPLSREAVVETLVAFSPDSRLVAFRSNRDGADGVYVVPIDGTPVARPVKITSVDFDANVSATWTPDRLVMRIANNQVNLYRVDVNPSNRRVLAEPLRLTEDSPVSNNPQVSPDGRRIAYVSRGRPSGFAVMNANGTNERVFKELPVDVFARMNLVGWISETEVLITDPGPGPDAPRTVPKKLLGINVLTGTSRSVGPDSYGVSFQLLAGGNLLFQVPGPGNDVLTIRPLTGGVAATTTVPIADWWGRAASADGRWLAYSTVDASPGRGKPWPGDIRVRSLDSGIERVLLKFADSNSASHAPLDLSADGKWLIYQDPKLTLRIADCETGESWPLLVNAPSEVDFEWPLVRWAPDGSFIVLSGTISRATYRAYEGIAQDAVTKAMTGRK
jgi:Tol biopolymer transport system component